jgi:hypothetical protein
MLCEVKNAGYNIAENAFICNKEDLTNICNTYVLLLVFDCPDADLIAC